MAKYDEIGDFISNHREVVENIDTIICSCCDGKEKYACAGCTKELAMINLIIDFNK